MARFIGITCHSDPAVLPKALERHDFDCAQMALNAALSGMAEDGPKPLGTDELRIRSAAGGAP